MISQEEAIRIAEKHHGPGFVFYGITHGIPFKCGAYGMEKRAGDDVWCILCSANPGRKGVLCSSRAIVISKDTGEILYDGSADDEG